MDTYEPYPWLEGERISIFLGRLMIKCLSVDGHRFVAKKVAHHSDYLESEAYMLKYATDIAHVRAPKLHQMERQRNVNLMVTDFDPGVLLESVWRILKDTDKASIKKQLQEQIRRMRTCTKPFIGRVNVIGEIDVNVRFPDPCHPSTRTACTTFPSEAEFDAHKINEVRKNSPIAAIELQKRTERLSKCYTQKFVLTHGDLNARNIHVMNTRKAVGGNPVSQISSILDWERSGFFPEYMGYTLAKISGSHDPEWRTFLTGLLEEMQLSCSDERVLVELMATDQF
jgi:Phosphotransferase enzyme family